MIYIHARPWKITSVFLGYTHIRFKHSRCIFDELFWHLLSARTEVLKIIIKQNSEFVTQQEIVSVSFLNKESLHSGLQIPTDALMDLK